MTGPEKDALAVLSPFLGERLAQAIIEFRSFTIKKKLTGYAAELLVKEYLKTGDAKAAAEMQISMSWQGFKADWYFREQQKQQQHHRGSPNGRRTAADAARDYEASFDYRLDAIGLPSIGRH